MHGLALRSDHTIVGWGYDRFGQADPPGAATNVVAIAAGGNHSLALRTDGSVIGWGRDNFGQASAPVDLSNVVAIAAGSTHSLALLADGTVLGWGRDNSGQITVPASLSNAVAVAAGSDHSMSLAGGGRPAILAEPSNKSVALGSSANLEVWAIGRPPLRYQRQVNGIDLPGATSSSLVLSSVGPADAGDYQVKVLSNLGCIVSKTATLVVETPEPVIATTTIGEGGEFQFEVFCYPGLLYQVEASTNLWDWSTVWATNALSNKFTFIELDPIGWDRRFYRIEMSHSPE